MSPNNESVNIMRAGVFALVSQAEHAIDSLKEAGFTSQELSVLCSNDVQEEHFSKEVTESVSNDKAAQAATAGSAIGGLLGAAGAGVGLATVVGIPIVVVGSLAGLLTGGIVGGLTGAMVERGFEPDIADYFDQSISEGKVLITVEPIESRRERLDLADRILRESGAEALPMDRS